MSDVFIDPRDGNIYKTIEIDNQIWLAENLRFEGVEFFVPNGNENNIPKYGYLYTWENAMAACPSGWHLPSRTDFEQLLRVAGRTDRKRFIALASLDWNGNDLLGFGVLPSGFHYPGGYDDFGSYGYYWSSTPYGSNGACSLDVGSGGAFVGNGGRSCAFSVRCIKD